MNAKLEEENTHKKPVLKLETLFLCFSHFRVMSSFKYCQAAELSIYLSLCQFMLVSFSFFFFNSCIDQFFLLFFQTAPKTNPVPFFPHSVSVSHWISIMSETKDMEKVKKRIKELEQAIHRLDFVKRHLNQNSSEVRVCHLLNYALILC